MKACGWNLTSPGQVLKSMQIVGQHILKYSKDDLTSCLAEISRSKAKNAKSRQWSPGVALDELESIVSFNIAFGGRCDTKKLGLYDLHRLQKLARGGEGPHTLSLISEEINKLDSQIC